MLYSLLRLMRSKLYGHFLPAHSLSNDAGCFRGNLSFGIHTTICIPFAAFFRQQGREIKDFSPQRVRHGESCKRKIIFVTPFTRLARVRFHPDVRGQINQDSFQTAKTLVTNVAGCIMVTANGHATVRTGDVFPPEWLFTQIRATAGTNLG